MIKPTQMVVQRFAEKSVVVKGIVFILVTVAIAINSGFAQPLATSSWPSFRRNTSLHAFAPVHGPVLPEIKWQAQFGSGQLGSPVVGADGTIYVPGNEDNALYAITPDGKLKWTFTGKMGDEELFVAPPVIAQDGTIYLGSTKNIFYAIDPTGTERWTLELGGTILFSANIGNDGAIYVAAQDCFLYAITPGGEIEWKYFLNRLPGNGPALTPGGMIYVAAGEFLTGVNRDAHLYFEFDNDDMGTLNGLMTEGNTLFYITALRKPFIKALNNDRQLVWQREFGTPFKSSLLPAMGKGGRIYFAAPDEGGVVALNNKGNQLWVFTSPGAKNIGELVVDDSNHVYLANDKQGLISVSAAGKLRWSLPEVRGAFSPAFGSDGTLYVSSNRKLYAIRQALKATSIAKVSGDLQIGCIETALPLPIFVQVKDQNGNPFTNHAVRFRVLSGGGTPVDTTVLTKADGVAQILWRLGKQPGQQQLEASTNGANGPLQGSPIIFTATANPPKFEGNRQLVFDSTEVKLAAEKFYFIRNNSECMLRIDSVRIIDDPPQSFFLRTTTLPILIQPGKRDSLRLQFVPQGCGSQTGILRIFNNDPTQPQFDVTLRGTARSRPDIEVASASNFPAPVCRQTSDTLALPIFNLGCANLRITNLAVSNPAFRVIAPLPPFDIPPSGQASVRVAFTPLDTITYNGVLTITSNDPDESSRAVNLTGKGIASVVALKAPPFGNVCPGQLASTRFCIINPSDCELRVDSTSFLFIGPVLAQGGQRLAGLQAGQRLPGLAQVQPFVIAPKDSFCVNVNVEPRRPGNFTVEVEVWSNAAQSPAKIVIPGTALPPDIDGLTQVLFDMVEVQTCAGINNADTVMYEIKNLGICDLKIDTLFTDSPVFSVIPKGRQTIIAGSSVPVQLIFAPNAQGNYAGKLTIRSDDPKERDFMVTLSGAAQERPDIDAMPRLVDFGSVSLGSSKRLKVQIRNLGAAILLIGQLATTSPAFTTESGEIRLNCNENREIEVVFTPTTTGLFNDTLKISNNDPNENPTRVILRGIGVQQEITVTPDSMEFGFVCSGGDSLLPVTVKNEGTDTLRVISLTFSNPAFSTTHAPSFKVAPGASEVILVRYVSVPGREDRGTLIIASNDSDEGSIVVHLHGQGAKPDIAFASADTAWVCSGNVASLPFCIKNPSACVLEISSIEILFSSSGLLKAPEMLSPRVLTQPIFIPPHGEYCDFKVNVRPRQPGTFLVEIKVFSNAPGKSPITHSITVIGLPAEIAGVEKVDFDSLKIGASVQKDAQVWNVDSCDVRLDSAKVTGREPAFTVGAITWPRTLDAGDTIGIPVIFTPMRLGPHTDTLLVFNNDPNHNPLRIVLTGKGVHDSTRLTANPILLDFGNVCGPADSIITITNHGQTPVQVDTLRFSNPVFSSPQTPPPSFDVPANGSVKITVRFTPVISGRLEIGTLTIISNVPGVNKPVISLKSKGGVPDIDGVAQVNFNPVLVSCAGSRNFADTTYVIRNVGDCNLRIDSLLTNFPFSVLSPAVPQTIPKGGSLAVRLRFMPDSARVYAGVLRIKSNDPDEPSTFIDLRGGGVAAPAIAALPDTLDFGSVPVDSTRRLLLKIMSVGVLQLRVDSLATSCPQFRTEADEFVLNCGKDSSVTVAFTPTASGRIICALSIFSNDPSKNPLKVTLRGNGATGILQACQSIPATPSLCLGDSTKIAYKLCNVGKAPLTIDSVKLAVRTDFRNARIVSLSNRVAPDSAITITITFAPKQAGSWGDTLLVYANLPPKTTVRIPLKGESSNDPGKLAVHDRLLDFSTHLDLVQRKLVRISNDGCQPLRIDGAKVVERRFRGIFWVDPQFRLPIELGGQTTIDVPVYFKGRDFRTFVDSLYVYSSNLNVASSRASSNGLNAAASRVDTVRLIGKVPDGMACIEVSPERLDFGQWPVGQSKILTLMVSNCSPDNQLSRIRVRAIQPPRGEFFTSPETLWVFPRNAQSIAVKFAPLRQGESLDTLRLIYHTQDSAQIISVLKVPLRGFGTGKVVYALPNAFTPNDDDKNDRAKIRFAGYDSSQVTLRIFDLRGVEVRSLTAEFVERDATGFYVPWDGFNGSKQLQMPGTYLWMLEEKGKRAGSGQIVLIR